MNTIYRKVLVRAGLVPSRGAGAADTSDEGMGEGGENKVFSGPVQKHLTSLRAQEGRAFLQIHLP